MPLKPLRSASRQPRQLATNPRSRKRRGLALAAGEEYTADDLESDLGHLGDLIDAVVSDRNDADTDMHRVAAFALFVIEWTVPVVGPVESGPMDR